MEVSCQLHATAAFQSMGLVAGFASEAVWTQEDKKNSLLLPEIELKIFGRKVRSVYCLSRLENAGRVGKQE
jgi:hypothetical protein